MSRDRPRRGVLPPAQENVEKLAKLVKDGNCYGAQQMYKSVSARYISAERYSDALDILQSGACIQLEYEQVTCGVELAVLFVETLVKGKFPYDEDTLGDMNNNYVTIYDLYNGLETNLTRNLQENLQEVSRIPVPQHLNLADDDDLQKLHEAFGAAKTRVDGCSSFLKAAIKWSAEFGAYRNGSPELHDMLAEYIYSESPEVEMTRVSYHFVRGKHPRKFASTLINFMGKCYPGEDDIAIARSVFMYLSLGNLRDANYLMDELKKQVKGKEVDFPKSDLIQFINYLLQTLQRDALPLFNMLRQTYKSSIDREPVFNELLDVIGEKFYGVQRRNLLQGIFGDMFKKMGDDGM